MKRKTICTFLALIFFLSAIGIGLHITHRVAYAQLYTVFLVEYGCGVEGVLLEMGFYINDEWAGGINQMDELGDGYYSTTVDVAEGATAWGVEIQPNQNIEPSMPPFTPSEYDLEEPVETYGVWDNRP